VAPEHIALWLAGLRAPLGVYAVLGNHDNVLGAPRMRNAFAAVKIPLIDESSRRITQGRFDFWLIGLADYLTAHPEPKKVLASVDGSVPVIAVAHNPDVMPLIDERVNLLIAGHTHGGQVRLPFYGALATSSEYGKRYEIGHIVEQTDLYVCPGIGTSILPIRFLDPPEICMLTLTGTDPSTLAPTASR
jgi:predicted MPP superfamily phosphohydrolase